ncbi:MAG: endolytic transglycosylase MltG [Microgenomates group bacterium]|nr:endolytic transglycosylase MltG [Microgenomates group bacterium]
MKSSKKISLFLFLFSILVIFAFLVYKEGTLPVNKQDQTAKIFVIKKGESLTSIVNNLSREGLIRNKIVFYLIVKKMGIEKKIQAGDFRLNPAMNAYQIAKILTHGTLDVWVTIIEGLRKEEIATIIAKNLDLPELEFVKLAPEGYLFPDTYLIPKTATIEAVIKILTNNFNKKYQPLREKAKAKGFTDDEIVTLASLVEKEAKYEKDRLKVASIILKRLKNNWPLQIDATIQYALGYQSEEKSWWKKNLTKDDLKIDSPYNTYTHTGLPPGPICNPGLASIKAAVNADENTPYWYYLSDKKGGMHYAVTLEEHNKNIATYLH